MLDEEAWRHLVGGWRELVVTDDCEVSGTSCECGAGGGAKETPSDHFLPQATFQSS